MFNVATGGRISLNSLYQVLQNLTGRAIPPSYGSTRVGDVRDSQADISAAGEILGYQPAVGLEAGLAKTLAWSREDAAKA